MPQSTFPDRQTLVFSFQVRDRSVSWVLSTLGIFSFSLFAAHPSVHRDQQVSAECGMEVAGAGLSSCPLLSFPMGQDRGLSPI